MFDLLHLCMQQLSGAKHHKHHMAVYGNYVVFDISSMCITYEHFIICSLRFLLCIVSKVCLPWRINMTYQSVA